jgi:hypothetical protein
MARITGTIIAIAMTPNMSGTRRRVMTRFEARRIAWLTA